MSFPAMAATFPVRFAPWWARARFKVYREEPLIVLDAEDFAFFVAVGVLWYWIGAKVDRLRGRGQSVEHSKAMSVALAATGFLFAVGVGAVATIYAMLTDADKPLKQVGPFGLVWSVMLLCYFSWRLVGLCKRGAPHDALIRRNE
jgi:hypothetical protein